jgi:hypothetical protein
MKKSFKMISLLVSLVLIMIACDKKDKESDPTPGDDDTGNSNTPKGMLSLHLHNYLDISEIDGYNIVYTTSEGRKISFTKAQFYLSEFELVKLDGSVYAVSGKNILKVQENQVYQLGEVPVGNYKSIRFKVGLNSATNATVPSSSSSDILNKPDMWFGNTAQQDGYVFFHLSGNIDTTVAANADEAHMVPFQYRVGTNAQYKQVIMPDKNFSIIANQVEFAHMYSDLSKMFNGIQLHVEDNLTMVSTADNATTLGVTLGNNMDNIFFYEE